MLNAVDTIKSNYQRFLAKLKKHPQIILKLPNLKLVIEAISLSESEEPLKRNDTSKIMLPT